MMNNMITTYQIITAVFLLVILCVLIVILRSVKRKAKTEKELYDNIMECCKKSNNITHTINAIFKILSVKIQANEYAFYMIDSKNTQFNLKSIHYKNKGNDQLNLSYSGLIPHKNVKYVFPLSIQTSEVKEEFGIIEDEKVKIAFIKISGGKGFIQMVVDPDFKFKKQIVDVIKDLSIKLEPVVSNLVQTEQLNNKIKILETSKQATKNITSIISGEGLLTMAINMFTKTISAKGGFFLKQEGDKIELEVATGFSKETHVLLKYDHELHQIFSNLIGNKKIATLNSNDVNFETIPIYLTTEGVKQILLFKIQHEENGGIAGFWYDQDYEIDEYQTYSLLLMFSKISEVFGISKVKCFGENDNLETLKFISTLVDDLSPYTVGFSSLMEHYTNMLTEEMKLSKKEANEISLAAFLSNIGIAALSYDIFLKKGTYTEFDYEIIKLHSEVGADIIESLLGNNQVADMVRFHHERMDGCGYPHGLKGEEIPLGARILAVIQFFIAKISPRNFREASTFDEALLALKSAVNTQLDEQIVLTFINLINRLRKENLNHDGSLDYCRNMRFVSKELCSKCPANMREDKKCWECKSNLCVAHGNKCETCFIYTEYMGRNKLK